MTVSMMPHGAGSLARNQRWSLHEIALIALGFVLPFGSTTSPAVFGNQYLKILFVASVAVALLFLVATTSDSLLPGRLDAPFAIFLFGFSSILVCTSLLQGIPSDRMQLLAIYLTVIVGFALAEMNRVGAFADIAYRVGVAHLLFALVTDQRLATDGGVERLSGGTHPNLIGFEAAAVLGYAILGLSLRRRRVGIAVSLVVGTVSVYVLLEAFSRTAIISVAVGLVILILVRQKSYRLLVSAAALLAGGCAAWFLSGLIFDYLAGGDSASLLSASGRYSIWDRVLQNNTAWWSGWGFGAMRDGSGPDANLYHAVGGFPVENSFLEAVMMGGLLAGALWLALMTRIIYNLLLLRDSSHGVSVYLIAILVLSSLSSVGLSGVSYNFWWALGAASLAASLNASSREHHFNLEGPAQTSSPTRSEEPTLRERA